MTHCREVTSKIRTSAARSATKDGMPTALIAAISSSVQTPSSCSRQSVAQATLSVAELHGIRHIAQGKFAVNIPVIAAAASDATARRSPMEQNFSSSCCCNNNRDGWSRAELPAGAETVVLGAATASVRRWLLRSDASCWRRSSSSASYLMRSACRANRLSCRAASHHVSHEHSDVPAPSRSTAPICAWQQPSKSSTATMAPCILIRERLCSGVRLRSDLKRYNFRVENSAITISTRGDLKRYNRYNFQ